jgi:Acyl-protein synthetase, LuxE
VSALLHRPPYGERDDAHLLADLNAVTQHHLAGCTPYSRMWPDAVPAEHFDDVPYVHVGVFKHVDLRTQGGSIRHQRTLLSSATTSGQSSRIALDDESAQLQSQSSCAILTDFVGLDRRPLLVLDSARGLRQQGAVSARMAAAMSLQPLTSEMYFLLNSSDDLEHVKWETVLRALAQHDDLLVYGFTYVLWLTFSQERMPAEVRRALQGKRIHFVHSGGWKKLEALSVSRDRFDADLLEDLDPASKVVDYYGLVEQVGVVYPLCSAGYRHVPVWAAVVVRDSATLQPLIGEPGQLQLMNPLAWGAPYHSVLTEDLGRIVAGACACGRSGPRFELLGRVPKSETRGCANV